MASKKENTEALSAVTEEAEVSETVQTASEGAAPKSAKPGRYGRRIDGGGKTEVELFRDSKDYKDDVFVAVNGKGIQIKRGVRVKIPVSYAKVLRRGQKQDTEAARLADKKQDEFYEETQRI